MRIRIDFAPARLAIPLRSLVLFAGALFVLGITSWNCLAELDAANAIESQVQAARQPVTIERIRLSTAQTESINRAIRQLNLPWDRLFAETESRLTERVALISLEPDAANRVLRLQGEAKSANDMIDFVASLHDQDFFRKATLVRHEIVETNPNRPVRFVAEAQWRPE